MLFFYFQIAHNDIKNNKSDLRTKSSASTTKCCSISADNRNMGLHKNYLKVGQNAGNQIFGIPRVHRGSTPLSMLISYGAKFNSSKLIHIHNTSNDDDIYSHTMLVKLFMC
jgi:hypothetical protein